jgi:ElaB/YqjD/DUF883 family membrane-anchored ribosome-binding protein
MAGRIEQAAGGFENDLGKALGSEDLGTDGAVREAKGRARKVAGKVQDGIDKVADQLSGAVATAGETTRSAYDVTSQRARQIADKVQPIVDERPYAFAAVALGVGVVIGLLLNAGGPKIIYVKPRD